MLSIKQKQVLGVTSIVVLVVAALSGLQLMALTRTLLQESRARGELTAMTIYHRAQDVVASEVTAYEDLRRDSGVRAALEAALYSEDVVYAAIVDRSGSIVAHSDPTRVGERLPEGDDLLALADAPGLSQLRAVYQTERLLEWRQAMRLGGVPFADVRVGLSTLLIRRNLTAALQPAALAAALALLVAIIVAVALAQVVLRPIHVIRNGLTRLGRGDLGASLDLEEAEFRELGDVFAGITDQLRAALPGRAERQQVMELSRRIAALGRLTAGVAHEVRNPLNAMTIHLELLRQKLTAQAEPEGAVAHVEVIAQEIRRLDEVVQGFLKFARPEELSLYPVSLPELVEEVISTMAVEAEVNGVTVETAIAEDVPRVEADAGLLHQALLNLARNAVQAMPKGGVLRIRCAPGKDGRVELRISDTGVGIAPEHLARIFDLYFSTKEGGTGIGLSIVYRTVQLHRGDIDVESTSGVGTTFVIKLRSSPR
ncbi:MAG: ATP-binding protein [Acidobacteriota bacterium]